MGFPGPEGPAGPAGPGVILGRGATPNVIAAAVTTFTAVEERAVGNGDEVQIPASCFRTTTDPGGGTGGSGTNGGTAGSAPTGGLASTGAEASIVGGSAVAILLALAGGAALLLTRRRATLAEEPGE